MSDEPDVYDGVIAIGSVLNVDAPADHPLPEVRFVHYPGAQQLILWLPQPAHQGYDELLVERDGAAIERGPVAARMNGSVQILFATLAWTPGEYRIVITHKDGWRHEVSLRKYSHQHSPVVSQPRSPPEHLEGAPIGYRDGRGRALPDQDLELRARARALGAAGAGRRLTYEGDATSGVATYVDGLTRIRFVLEARPDQARMLLEIPAVEHWEGFTKTPLCARDEILSFLVEQLRALKGGKVVICHRDGGD